jgi:hypothetical protein
MGIDHPAPGLETEDAELVARSFTEAARVIRGLTGATTLSAPPVQPHGLVVEAAHVKSATRGLDYIVPIARDSGTSGVLERGAHGDVIRIRELIAVLEVDDFERDGRKRIRLASLPAQRCGPT